MKSPCVFVAQGFSRENVPLQPWRYIYEIAIRFALHQPVIVITDGTTERTEAWDEQLMVVSTPNLSICSQRRLTHMINSLSPAEIWWSATPRSIAYSWCWQRLKVPITAMITCPLYYWSVLLRAKWKGGVPYRELRSLFQQRLIPRRLWGILLACQRVERIVTQSLANFQVLKDAGVPESKISVVPVGINRNECLDIKQDRVSEARRSLDFDNDSFVFMYLGAIRSIRGIDALLEAFFIAARKNEKIALVILARGANDGVCAALERRCREAGVEEQVRVKGGWLSRDTVWAHLKACDAVALPFVVVPSDVPIAVLEALICGKPVIGSNVDGIPELVQGRGVVVDPLDREELSDALLSMADPAGGYPRMAAAASRFIEECPDWDQVGRLAMEKRQKEGVLV